jgi:hypothetical protein
MIDQILSIPSQRPWSQVGRLKTSNASHVSRWSMPVSLDTNCCRLTRYPHSGGPGAVWVATELPRGIYISTQVAPQRSQNEPGSQGGGLHSVTDMNGGRARSVLLVG